MRKNLAAWTVAVLFAAIPMVSNAAVIQLITPSGAPSAANVPVNLTPPDFESGAISFVPGGSEFTQTYTFTAQADLSVINFSLNAIGPAADVATTTWQIGGVAPNVSGSFVPGAGQASVANFSMTFGDQFTIALDGTGVGIGSTASYQFNTTEVSPVPVPAALPLLAGGVALLGVASRRRRKA